LGVVLRSLLEEVEERLRMRGRPGEEMVETNGGGRPLREALTERYEVHRVSKKWNKGLAERAGGDARK
jgi:Sulfite reductase, alpha subunit (flavoprotein)